MQQAIDKQQKNSGNIAGNEGLIIIEEEGSDDSADEDGLKKNYEVAANEADYEEEEKED